nr:hypothetical protein [uncultured Niameybacter sp.]
MDSMMPTILGIGIISLLINLALFGVGAYLVYLVIKALKIYIKKNKNN